MSHSARRSWDMTWEFMRLVTRIWEKPSLWLTTFYFLMELQLRHSGNVVSETAKSE